MLPLIHSIGVVNSLLLIDPRLDILIRVSLLHQVPGQTGRDVDFSIPDSFVGLQVLMQVPSVHYFLVLQVVVLQFCECFGINAYFGSSHLHFLLIHSPLLFEVPLVQEAQNQLLLLVSNEESDVSHLVLVPLLVLLSSLSLELPLLVVKKLFENLSFKFILVMVEHGIQLQESLWKELDSLDLVVVQLAIGGVSLPVELGVSANESGLRENLISDILHELSVVSDFEIIIALFLVHGSADVGKLLLVLDEKYGPVVGLEVLDVLVFSESFFFGNFFLGQFRGPFPLASGRFGLEAIGVD